MDWEIVDGSASPPKVHHKLTITADDSIQGGRDAEKPIKEGGGGAVNGSDGQRTSLAK